MFKQAIVALLFSSAMADMLKANTPKGRALLKHATVIEPSVHLRRAQENEQYQYYQNQNYDGQQQWNQYQNEGEYELEISRLSLKYLGCSEWTGVDYEWQQEQQEQQMQYYYQNQYQNQQAQQNGQDQQQEQQQQQYQNYQQNYNDGMVKQSLVRFTLCTEGCGSCSGEYAVDMLQFIDAYTESKMDTLEYQCEMIRERCYCQNGNWEQCFYDCYEQAEFDLYGSDAGVQYCLQEYYGQEAFELQQYLECAEVEQVENNGQNQQQYNGYNYANGQGGNYNYNGQGQEGEEMQYFVGPYCSENKYIFLGAFYDEDCTYKAKNAKFQGQNYGSSFPYFKESIIEPNECISCQETESYYQMKQAYKQQQYYAQNANNQQYGNNGQAEYYNYAWDYDMDYGDANEVCNSGFEDAIKCDKNRGYYSGCNFIDSTLPKLDGRGNAVKASSHDVYEKFQRNKNTAIIMGVICALLLGALAFMCGLCGGGGDPKKIALLEKKRMGEGAEEGQLA